MVDGRFVAQALAVMHPNAVRRVILSSTAPGDGRFVLSTAGPSLYPGELLFPADQHNAARAQAFERSIRRYRGFYEGSQAIADQQATAVTLWVVGQDPAGHLLGRLRAPVLIGDGAQDRVTPVADSHILAAEIPHAQLKIYPDAAHGFLFQHAADWLRRVARFLG